jgi:hypothetical protein
VREVEGEGGVRPAGHQKRGLDLVRVVESVTQKDAKGTIHPQFSLPVLLMLYFLSTQISVVCPVT